MRSTAQRRPVHCLSLNPREMSIVPIESRIMILRGRRVILDAALAELYRVPVKRLNEQTKRNKARFPVDFMFRLTPRK
jgi:hypothetical protein